MSQGCSVSTNLMSTQLAFSMRLHTPFVWRPAERTKVVPMDAPQNRYGFEMFFLWFFLNQGVAWVFCGVNGLQELLQFLQCTKSLLKVLSCLHQQILILPFVNLWRAVNVDDLVDDLGCRWGVYLIFWTWRIAWEVRKRGELGRREFHAEGAVGDLARGLLGVFLRGFFRWG